MKKVLHEGVEILESTIDNKTLKSLKTLAGVLEENIEIFENGFKFSFENSLRANRCKVVRYHDNVILELRKVSDNIIEGTYDKLVFERVIKPQEFKDVFESQTGIYLSYV